jgi:membrane protease YdiL (CAAX protease family)
MTDLVLPEPAAPPAQDLAGGAAPARPRRWGFWATCAWGIAIFAVMTVAQIGAGIVVLVWWHFTGHAMPTTAAGFAAHAVVLSTAALASLPACVLMLMLAVRLARTSVADYLALKPVDAKILLVGVACTLGYAALLDILALAGGRPLTVPFVQELYRTARETGTLPLVVLGVVVAAPLTEELFFRGFLLRGWAASRLGVVGAVVLTAAIWAAMHVQYDWITIAGIFGLGLLFGSLRIRSGSTLTTMVLHGVFSMAALVQAAILAG